MLPVDAGGACSFRKVGYVYPGSQSRALVGLDLEVARGEWIALLGANGSGKSTFARLCNALLIPTQGDCSVLGLDTRVPANAERIRRGVAMVFQNPENQIVASVVEEETAFGPENLGLPPQEIRARVDQALRVVGLWEKRRAATYALSGGQKQRLALAGALALDPEVLVLDEATAMVDPRGRTDFVSLLGRLHRQGKTLIQITHRLEEILEADRVVVLNGGVKVFDGTPQGLFDLPKEAAAWGLGIPPLVSLRRFLLEKGLIPEQTPPRVEALEGALCP